MTSSPRELSGSVEMKGLSITSPTGKEVTKEKAATIEIRRVRGTMILKRSAGSKWNYEIEERYRLG